MHLLINAALHGAGLAIVIEDMVAPSIADGRLVRVLQDWSPPFSGYHLYYPNRRHPSPAFAALLEELRANSYL
jgi:DNA-binding transcriptional LysR family regulator